MQLGRIEGDEDEDEIAEVVISVGRDGAIGLWKWRQQARDQDQEEGRELASWGSSKSKHGPLG